MKFRATIELGGKTATGFVVPDAVVEKLGGGKRPAYRVVAVQLLTTGSGTFYNHSPAATERH